MLLPLHTLVNVFVVAVKVGYRLFTKTVREMIALFVILKNNWWLRIF
jgi:hypothetical protein